jgi:hypothetical protein
MCAYVILDVSIDSVKIMYVYAIMNSDRRIRQNYTSMLMYVISEYVHLICQDMASRETFKRTGRGIKKILIL